MARLTRECQADLLLFTSTDFSAACRERSGSIIALVAKMDSWSGPEFDLEGGLAKNLTWAVRVFDLIQFVYALLFERQGVIRIPNADSRLLAIERIYDFPWLHDQHTEDYDRLPLHQ